MRPCACDAISVEDQLLTSVRALRDRGTDAQQREHDTKEGHVIDVLDEHQLVVVKRINSWDVQPRCHALIE